MAAVGIERERERETRLTMQKKNDETRLTGFPPHDVDSTTTS